MSTHPFHDERSRLYWRIHEAIGHRISSPSRRNRMAEQAAMAALRAFDERYLLELETERLAWIAEEATS